MFHCLAKFKLIPEDSIWFPSLSPTPRARSSCTVKKVHISAAAVRNSQWSWRGLQCSVPNPLQQPLLAEMTETLHVVCSLLLYLQPPQNHIFSPIQTFCTNMNPHSNLLTLNRGRKLTKENPLLAIAPKHVRATHQKSCKCGVFFIILQFNNNIFGISFIVI